MGPVQAKRWACGQPQTTRQAGSVYIRVLKLDVVKAMGNTLAFAGSPDAEQVRIPMQGCVYLAGVGHNKGNLELSWGGFQLR